MIIVNKLLRKHNFKMFLFKFHLCRLKSTIPQRNKIPDDELVEGRSPFSNTNASEEINNTMSELRPQNNISNTNHSDHIINSIETPNSTLGDKSSANLTMQNTGNLN